MIVPININTPAACLPGCSLQEACNAMKVRQTLHGQLYTIESKIVCFAHPAGASCRSPQTAILSSQERQKEQR